MAESNHANGGGKVGISSIELKSDVLTEETLIHVEEECNQAIRDHLGVQVKMYQVDDPELKAVTTNEN